jgi:hypothetical protein
MLDCTISAVTAAIRNHDPDHSALMIWIDAFCIPIEPHMKRATLESMGFICSRATQVVVVLLNEAFAAIEEMSQLDTAKISSSVANILDLLENNEWVRSISGGHKQSGLIIHWTWHVWNVYPWGVFPQLL